MPAIGAQKDFRGTRWEWAALTPAFIALPTQLSDGMLAAMQELTGVPDHVIAEANGVRWDTPEINDWTIASGGYWARQPTGMDPVRGSPTGGWALWVAGNELWMPAGAMDRVGEAPPAETPEGGGGMLAAAGIGLLVLAGFAAAASRKRRS